MQQVLFPYCGDTMFQSLKHSSSRYPTKADSTLVEVESFYAKKEELIQYQIM